MGGEKKEKIPENIEVEEQEQTNVKAEEEKEQLKDNSENLEKEISELKDKYLRLYAEFENYKRLVAKDKEELIKYANEELIKELLTVIDHLELALQHTPNSDNSSALAEGVQMTLKELKNTLEKFDLVSIESLDKPFDPFVHHAISQVETDEEEENTVITEFRKGYKLKDRVLRAALVAVSKKPSRKTKEEE